MKTILLFLTLLLPACASHPAWQRAADARIEACRKSDFILTLTLDGQPLANTPISIRQLDSDFHFGTAINGWMVSPGRDAFARRNQAAYWGFVASHFNTIVSEDDMKWYSVEKEQGKLRYQRADALLKLAEDYGLAVRGHCLLWGKLKYIRRQPWVEDLSDADLAAAIDRHIADIVTRYKGRLIAWDVLNEMLDGTWYKDRLGEAIRPHVFQAAHAADPAVPLFLNEYHILDSDARTDAYIALVKHLQAQGATIGGLGIQEHFAERFAPPTPGRPPDPPDPDHPERQASPRPLDLDKVYARLDRLAALGLPIQLTEVSFKTADETRRAAALENFYRLIYSHPQVNAILLWGFWANSHFLGPTAALVDEDWHTLPAGQRYEALVLKQWRTKTAATTDRSGTAAFRGFHGTYRIALTLKDPATGKDRHFARTVSLTAATPTATLDFRSLPKQP